MKKLIRSFLYQLSFCYKILRYTLRKDKINKKVFSKPKIKVVFFVLYDNMWKSDGLFKKLEESERFEPYIISSPYPRHPRKFGEENQDRLERFFLNKGFSFIKGYDFKNNSWFDIQSFKPDIVFYQQPYNSGYKGFRIEALWKNSLFGYIPYTYELENSSNMVNQLLPNIAWRVFLPSIFDVNRQRGYLKSGGEGLVSTGYPLADILCYPENPVTNPWKLHNNNHKRVIWAPHHSILSTDFLNYSNFLEIADDMLRIARKYKDTIQFAFKPHPVLKRKLYKLEGWGVEKTDVYYDSWANMPNTVLVEGDYADLFTTSDAMIHDSSTFTAEYLYTQKPVMYVTKQDRINIFNEFGTKCFELHYKGKNIEDIELFLNEVVLQGKDKMKKDRQLFFKENLLPPNGMKVFENMYSEFEQSLLPVENHNKD